MTPWQVYELSNGMTEEAVALRLIGLFDIVIVNANRRLAIKAWALSGSLLMIIITLATVLLRI